MHLYQINLLLSGPPTDVHLTCQVEELLPLHDALLRCAVIGASQVIDCSNLVLAQQD